jgi:glycosyltransferase involved in cell wall biosynthesis
MANQTGQLAQLLSEEGCRVTLVRTNAPYRPAMVGKVHGVRALFRLLPYVRRLWIAMPGAELVHVMANSGWAWHLFAAPAVWIAWLRGVPTVVNYRGGGADAFLVRQARLVRPTLAHAAAVAVPSGFLSGVFAKYGIATSIVPNIVNLDAFRPAEALPATPHLLVARNLEPIYDIATAIRAFAIVVARHAESRLTIAGSGPDRERLERLALELGVTAKVRFTGRLDNAALPHLYRTASVVVNASHTDNLPISLLEALAAGVPIVSTDVGGIPYVVKHETTALLVPPGDPDAMAAAILRLLGDPALARRLRAAGIDAARRYAWPKVRAELFALYARALGRAPTARGDADTAAPR